MQGDFTQLTIISMPVSMVVVMLIPMWIAVSVLMLVLLMVVVFAFPVFVVMMVLVVVMWRGRTAAAVVVTAVSRADDLGVIRDGRVTVRVAPLLHLAMTSTSRSTGVHVLFAWRKK